MPADVRELSPISPLATLTEEWLAGQVARGQITAKSAGTYGFWLETLTRRYFGARPVEHLDRHALLEWQATIGHYAPETRRKALGVVRQFCHWLVVEGHLPADPSVTLGKVRVPRRAPRALPAVDIPRILDACPTPERRYRVAVWLRPAAWLMVGCGLRCVEVSNLDLGDYDPERRSLFVSGKGGHERVLPVPQAAADALDEYLAERGQAPGPLLRALGSKADPSGRLSPKWIARRTAKLMHEAGVHREAWDGRTAHALRHTFATDCLAASGNDFLAVQQLLGHSSLQTTARYLAPASSDRLREAVESRPYLRTEGHRPQTAPPIIPPEPRRPAAPPRPGTGPVDTCKVHCPRCCRDDGHGPDCGGWQPIPVRKLRISGQLTAGYWYDATCPACRRRVWGDLSSDKAADYLRRGARSRTNA